MSSVELIWKRQWPLYIGGTLKPKGLPSASECDAKGHEKSKFWRALDENDLDYIVLLVLNTWGMTLILNTSVPQGTVLDPTLFILFPHDCIHIYSFNTTDSFAEYHLIGSHIQQQADKQRADTISGQVVF